MYTTNGIQQNISMPYDYRLYVHACFNYTLSAGRVTGLSWFVSVCLVVGRIIVDKLRLNFITRSFRH